MDRDTLLATLPPALARVRGAIAALARDAVVLLPATGADSLGATRLGGEPDLPASVAWPLWRGAAQAFVLQVRLADLAGLPAATELPASGWLWFFYDASQTAYGDDPSNRGAWRVLVAPGDATLAPRASPADLPAAARFASRPLRAVATVTIPEQPLLEEPSLDWTDAERQAYETWYGDRATSEGGPNHRLLGYPATI